MAFIKSFFLALSVFSRIPVPRVEWNPENMRYMMCAFPFVGLVIFIIQIFLFYVSLMIFSAPYIPALVIVLIPVAVTGGIHLDGFCDTCDALASHAEKERKLEILKDSHCGAFAVICVCVYFISYYALALQFSFTAAENVLSAGGADFKDFLSFIRNSLIIPYSSVFVLSRILSAFAVAVFPCAKNSGLVRSFSDNSARIFTVIWCILFFAAFSVFDILVFGAAGILSVAVCILMCAFYYFTAKKNFGGITGDTAGWFVQLCEILSLCAAVISGVLI